jgi:hypothetical protein
LTTQIKGTWTDAEQRTGKVRGTITPTRFSASRDGKTLIMRADVVLRVLGTGEGEITNKRTIRVPVKSLTAQGAPGAEQRGRNSSASPNTARVVPAAFGAGALAAPAPVPEGCDILNLDLGPLDLNLLGLAVVLQPVILDIVAVPGAGNLLGNLLCAVAGLLDGNGGIIAGLVGQISRLLNQILGILNGGLGGAAGSA